MQGMGSRGRGEWNCCEGFIWQEEGGRLLWHVVAVDVPIERGL